MFILTKSVFHFKMHDVLLHMWMNVPTISSDYCVPLFSMAFWQYLPLPWTAVRLYSRDIFHVEGCPLQRPYWRVIYRSILLYVFPTRNIVNFLSNLVNFLINVIFLTATYFP